MIPKIIHYCWLSNDPLPADFKRYIDGWQRLMPDYEIRRWDFNRFPRNRAPWVDEAFDLRKYAFAADYIRNYALYTEGGIYLDSDVEVLVPFERLLHLPYFMGFENGSGCIEAAVMGSEPGNPIFGRMLEYYKGRHFVNPDGTLNTLPLPKLMMRELSDRKIMPISSIEDFNAAEGVVSVFPYHYFSPIHIESRRLDTTDDTMAIHRFAGSWQPARLKLKKRIKKVVGPALTEWFIRTKRRISGKKP